MSPADKSRRIVPKRYNSAQVIGFLIRGTNNFAGMDCLWCDGDADIIRIQLFITLENQFICAN